MSLRATHRLVAVVAGTMFLATTAQAEQFRVTFENLQPTGGFSLTPAWVGFHDGTFDVFTTGDAASAELEALAELGNTAPLSTAFNTANSDFSDATLTAGAPPIISPGEIATQVINGGDNSYFSYASMIIPSNDTFIGNGDPLAFNVGNLGINESLTIDVTRFYDAGTEVNDPLDGGAFVAGVDGTLGTDEGGVITLDDFASFNAEFLNTNTPLGVVNAPLQSVIGRFTITAVPEPGSFGFLGALGASLLSFRRRRRK